jgi:mannose-6-phosphate isomerase-like protein (cupin superfamily)
VDVVNAIAKVRFSAAKCQHVILQKAPGLTVSLVCMQGGQTAKLPAGPCTYYVVTGSADLAHAGKTVSLAPGHSVTAAPGEVHQLTCRSEDRLVCIVVRPT